MKDRIPTKPGRIQLAPSTDGDDLFIITRADEPTQIGTALNKANLLTDETASALEIATNEPTVDDAFNAINSNFSRIRSGSGDPPVSGAKIGDLYIQDGLDGKFIYIRESSGWVLLARAKLSAKTVIIKESQYWDVPSDMHGNVMIRVFGGGAGGSASADDKSGGGGGEMSTWTGSLSESRYRVTIGKGGKPGSAGGASSFGNIISASGGSGLNGGSGGGGSHYGTPNPYAGNGSYGGGGGGASDGFIFGGNGGTYGGGGGGANSDNIYGGSGKNNTYSGSIQGGGGGYSEASTGVDGGDGLATPDDPYFPGVGNAGEGEINGSQYRGGGGGGGYGGNGGNGVASVTSSAGGGGGGYGGNGGNGDSSGGGGGGGGFGGNGGNANANGAGGGGGYGLNGNGGDGGADGGTAAGGGAGGHGGDGICIITYTGLELI